MGIAKYVQQIKEQLGDVLVIVSPTLTVVPKYLFRNSEFELILIIDCEEDMVVSALTIIDTLAKEVFQEKKIRILSDQKLDISHYHIDPNEHIISKQLFLDGDVGLNYD